MSRAETFVPRRDARRLGMVLLALSLAGCGPGRNAPVDVAVARATLQRTLETWRAGRAPESLRSASPEIVVQDLDWSRGAKLVDFEILDGAQPVDANLIAPVRLWLRTPEGKEAEKSVAYVVGTSPVRTVFRDMMR